MNEKRSLIGVHRAEQRGCGSVQTLDLNVMGGAPRQGRRGGGRVSSRWLWLLVPGNILFFLLVPHVWRQSMRAERVVEKHVFHLDPSEVWREHSVIDSGHFEPNQKEPSHNQQLLGGTEQHLLVDVSTDSDSDEDALVGEDELVDRPTHDAPAASEVGTSPQVEARAALPASRARALQLEAQVHPRNKGTFAYQRSAPGQCGYLCTLIRRHAQVSSSSPLTPFFQSAALLLNLPPVRRQGYRSVPGGSAPSLRMVRWYDYKKYKHLTNAVINQVGSDSSCIGGGKGKQLRCRQQLAARHGCDYASLPVQPAQWDLKNPSECREFFIVAAKPENAEQIWIMKPGGSFHGKGITLHKGIDAPPPAVSLQRQYGRCGKLPDGLILMRYISKPALWGGHKFDFRTYLLVASTKPVLVFYADAFIRRSENAYSTDSSKLTDIKSHITNAREQSDENHFFNFDDLQKTLTRENNFAPDYIDSVFRPHAMQVTNFLAQSAMNRTVLSGTGNPIGNRAGLDRVPGRFQLFALDWMLEADGSIHLLEANGDPLVAHYEGIGLSPGIWQSWIQLVMAIHTNPAKLEAEHGVLSVEGGFRYHNWVLVTNEMEQRREPYNACSFEEYAQAKHPLYGFY